MPRASAGGDPQGVWRDVPAHHGAGLDHRPFPNAHIGQNDAVGSYEDVFFDDHTPVAFGPPGAPVEMREDRCAQTDGAIVADMHIFGMQIIDIDHLGNPDVFPDGRSAHSMQPGPEAASPRHHKSEFVNQPAEDVSQHSFQNG